MHLRVDEGQAQILAKGLSVEEFTEQLIGVGHLITGITKWL